MPVKPHRRGLRWSEHSGPENLADECISRGPDVWRWRVRNLPRLDDAQQRESLAGLRTGRGRHRTRRVAPEAQSQQTPGVSPKEGVSNVLTLYNRIQGRNLDRLAA